MTAKDAILFTLKSNEQMVYSYLSDFSDADMVVRPSPTANHASWQMGHLIDGEINFFQSKIPGVKPPALPEGFSKQHNKEAASSQSTAGFLPKAEYISLYKAARAATITAVEALSDADFDKPSGWDMAPTLGATLLFIGGHDMMHAGQFTVIRRVLGKPILF